MHMHRSLIWDQCDKSLKVWSRKEIDLRGGENGKCQWAKTTWDVVPGGHLPLRLRKTKQRSMLLLSVIIIIICNRKLPKDTWWSVPQNCRSDEGQVSVEGRWQRKQPEDFVSIFLLLQSLVTIKQIRVEGRKLKAPSQSHLLLPLAKVLDTKHP